MSVNGTLAGTPTMTGTYSFSIQAASGSLRSIPKMFSMTVARAPVFDDGTMDTINLTEGYTTYRKDYTITGYPTPTTTMDTNSNTAGASISGGTLTIDTGLAPGTYSANFAATNSVGTANMAVTVNVAAAQAPAISGGATATTDTINLVEGYAAATKSYTVTGVPTPTQAMSALPGENTAGASISGGTLTIDAGLAPGNYTANFAATNSEGTANMAVTVNVAAATPISITTATLPTWTAGHGYSQQIATTGGAGAKTFTIDSGALPTGLSLNGSTGAISGTPSTAGSYTFAIKVVDSASTPTSDTQSYTVLINDTLFINISSGAQFGTVGVSFSGGIEAVNGTPPYTYALTGTLPPGLSFNAADGSITGTPSQAGAFDSMSATVTDGVGATATLPVTITINP